jgi:hypothetical protein
MLIPKPMKFDVKTNDKTKKSQDNAKPNEIKKYYRVTKNDISPSIAEGMESKA